VRNGPDVPTLSRSASAVRTVGQKFGTWPMRRAGAVVTAGQYWVVQNVLDLDSSPGGLFHLSSRRQLARPHSTTNVPPRFASPGNNHASTLQGCRCWPSHHWAVRPPASLAPHPLSLSLSPFLSISLSLLDACARELPSSSPLCCRGRGLFGSRRFLVLRIT
jgi:hypothetical protein